MNRIELQAALSLAAVYVLRMLGLFMVMPVLALLAVDYDHYSPLWVGIAIGGYGLTQAILQIPMGVMSDRFGRKPVILAGLLVFALGSVVAAMADSMLWLVVGRLLQGAGAIAGAVMALAADVSREDQRAKVMAIIGVAIGFSFYMSLLLGPAIAGLHGLAGVFGVTAVLAVACIPLVWWGVPAPKQHAPSGDTLPARADVLRLAKHVDLLRLSISVAVLHMLITLLFTQLPRLLADQNMTLDQHWQVYLPVLLASVAGMAVMMAMTRKWGQKALLVLSVVMLAVALAGLSQFAHQFVGLVVFVWLFFTGFNYLEANFPAMVSSLAPAGKKGSAMGIFASFQFAGAFAGGAISGLISEFFLPHLVLVAGSLLCLLWLVLLRNMRGTEALKRYTLAVNLSRQTLDEVRQKLAQLDGVRDITIEPGLSVAYLKVDSREFKLREAKTLASVNE